MSAFEDAWAKKEAEGYRYGRDALENVRFGYEMAQTEMTVDRRDFTPAAAAFMKRKFGLDVSIVGEATPNGQHFAIVGAWGAPKPITDEQLAAFTGFCAGWFAAHGAEQ